MIQINNVEDIELRIVRLEDIKSELQQHLRNRSLFPVIGSGFTKGCKSDGGRGEDVPTGQQMKEYMTKTSHM